MKKGIQPRTAIKVTNIAQYVHNKKERNNIFTVISSKGILQYFEGKQIEEKEINKLFPLILVPVNYKGVNPDHTKVV